MAATASAAQQWPRRWTASVTGKYPLMGCLLDENRRGTHLFKERVMNDPG